MHCNSSYLGGGDWEYGGSRPKKLSKLTAPPPPSQPTNWECGVRLWSQLGGRVQIGGWQSKTPREEKKVKIYLKNKNKKGLLEWLK
jgi:hypothetical protein